MKNPLKKDGLISPSEHISDLPSFASAPLVEAVRRRRKSYEIEDATLIEMAALLDALARKYRDQLGRHIEDQRLLRSSMTVASLHHSYITQEIEVTGAHIGRLFALRQQTTRELRVIRHTAPRTSPDLTAGGMAKRSARRLKDSRSVSLTMNADTFV